MYANKRSTRDTDQSAFALGYLFRSTEEAINRIAEETGSAVSSAELASRLAALLQAKASGSVLGAADRLPALRRTSRNGNPRKQPLALARSSRSNKTRRKVAAWTAKRRKEYSERMKRLQGKLQRARGIAA